MIVVDLAIWGLFRGNSYVMGKRTSGKSTVEMHATWWTVLDSHSDKRVSTYSYLSAIRVLRVQDSNIGAKCLYHIWAKVHVIYRFYIGFPLTLLQEDTLRLTNQK